jgi:hypothetical protein
MACPPKKAGMLFGSSPAGRRSLQTSASNKDHGEALAPCQSG